MKSTPENIPTETILISLYFAVRHFWRPISCLTSAGLFDGQLKSFYSNIPNYPIQIIVQFYVAILNCSQVAFIILSYVFVFLLLITIGSLRQALLYVNHSINSCTNMAVIKSSRHSSQQGHAMPFWKDFWLEVGLSVDLNDD